MKRWISMAVVITMVGAGCQATHQDNKKAAMERWKQARSNLLLEIAQQQFDTGELDKARDQAKHLLEINTDNVPARILLGRIATEKNQIAQAVDYFEQAIALDPQNADAYYYIGMVYERQNDLNSACQAYSQSWNIRKNHLPSFLAMLETLTAQGKQNDAWQLLQQNIDHMDHDARLYVLAGNLCTILGRQDEAASMYRRALNYQPDDQQITESLAFALVRSKQWREALVLWEQMDLNSEKPISDAALMAMGDCYLNLGRFNQAQRCFEKLSEKQPFNPIVWIGLAQAALGRQQFERAENYAKKALKIDPDCDQAYMVLGVVALNLNKDQQAQAKFQRVVDHDQTNALAWCFLGKTFQRTGDATTAKQCYLRAVRLNPNDALAMQLMDSLNSIAEAQYTP